MEGIFTPYVAQIKALAKVQLDLEKTDLRSALH